MPGTAFHLLSHWIRRIGWINRLIKNVDDAVAAGS